MPAWQRTWVRDIKKAEATVDFQILKQPSGKIACDGYFDYTMISLNTGRAEAFPDWIKAKYAI